jgi:hypothetical protein
MDTLSTSTTSSDTTQVLPPDGGTTDVCWCGQDMDFVHGSHCPRCGTARAVHLDAHLSRLVA